jgi:hypothetical protein
MRYQLATLVTASIALLPCIATATFGDIFVTNWDTGRVGQYSNAGATINASLVTGLNNPTAVGVSGSYLVVENYSTGIIGEWTLGAPGTVTSPFPNLITGLTDARGIAVNGADVYVVNHSGGNGVVARYTLGATPGTISSSNPGVITGLTGNPNGLAVVGGNLFVQFDTSVAEYSLTGTPINTSFITGLTGAQTISAQGNDLYVGSYSGGNFNVGKYTLGATPGTIASSTPNLITGLGGPMAISVFDNSIFMDSYAENRVQQYSTSGALINGSLVSSLTGSVGLTVTPEPASLGVLAVGLGAGLLRRRSARGRGK